MSLSQLQQSLDERRHHLSPFFVLGDPSPELTPSLALAAVEHGATMIELGIPFSDPVADGPAIQNAVARARSHRVDVDQCFEMIRAIRSLVEVPLNLLVYGNLVHARGYQSFARDAASVGASSLLVPDISFEEGESLREACAHHGIGTVFLAGPNTSEKRIKELSSAATGFLYLTGHQGVTGKGATTNQDRLQSIVQTSVCPVAIGFGIRTAGAVHDVFACGAQVAVVGSRYADEIEQCAAADPTGAIVRTTKELLSETQQINCKGTNHACLDEL